LRVNDVTVTAAPKIIKNSNHLRVRNVLHIKLVKLQSIWKSSSGQNCHSKSGKYLTDASCNFIGQRSKTMPQWRISWQSSRTPL